MFFPNVQIGWSSKMKFISTSHFNITWMSRTNIKSLSDIDVISMSPTIPCKFPLCWITSCCMSYFQKINNPSVWWTFHTYYLLRTGVWNANDVIRFNGFYQQFTTVEAFLTQQNGCCKAMMSLPDSSQTADEIWMLIQCRHRFQNDVDSKMSGRYLDCVAKRHDLGIMQSN